jgi:alpha-maltose-1-phosphate synthase
MRVAYLLDWYLFYATELSNAMSEEHDVLLIPRDHDLEISSARSKTSLKAYLDATLSQRIQRDYLRYRRADPRGFLEVLRIQHRISRWDADVLHFQETSDWRIVLLAALNHRRQIVLTVHDVENHVGESRGLQALLYKLLLRSAKKIVVHGEVLRHQFGRVFAERAARAEVVSIPHGVFSLYRSWDDPSVAEEPYTVLFFGRIAPYKGLEDLIAAQPKVTAQVPQARFLIAGAGQFDQYRKMICDAHAFEIHNRFISNEEIPRLFRRAAVVVLPYVEASQSGVIPIAYEFGKPVVVTNVGGLPEVVEHRGSGMVIEPGRPDQLAEAILELLTDVAMRKRLGAGARRIAETRLSWKTIAAQTAHMYAGTGR